MGTTQQPQTYHTHTHTHTHTPTHTHTGQRRGELGFTDQTQPRQLIRPKLERYVVRVSDAFVVVGGLTQLEVVSHGAKHRTAILMVHGISRATKAVTHLLTVVHQATANVQITRGEWRSSVWKENTRHVERPAHCVSHSASKCRASVFFTKSRLHQRSSCSPSQVQYRLHWQLTWLGE